MGKKAAKQHPPTRSENDYNLDPNHGPNHGPNGEATLPQNNGTFLGLDVKQLGMALAGVIVAELAEVLADQVMQKLSSKDRWKGVAKHDSDPADDPSEQPMRARVSKLGEQLQETGPALSSAADTVRSSVKDFNPSFDEIVDVLREVGQRVKAKSTSPFNASPAAVKAGVASSAKTAAAVLGAKAASSGLKKSPKKGKKKKKK